MVLAKILSINAVTLATRKMAASCVFYTGIGLKLTFGGPTAAFTTFSASSPVTQDKNAVHVNLFTSDEYEAPPAGTWNKSSRSVFFVDDVDVLHSSVVEAGLSPLFEPRDAPWGERYFHILDPNGHELSFATPQYDHPRWQTAAGGKL